MQPAKEKLVNELKEQLWRVNFDLNYNKHVLPSVEERKAGIEAEAQKQQAEIDEYAKNNDQKKKAVRDELKKRVFDLGKTRQRIGTYAGIIDSIKTNIDQAGEKITGIEAKLKFLETYEG